jgi:hypothetical protein
MANKITSERLKVVIHSLKRPNGGGIHRFVEEHSEELGILLEEHVLPQVEAHEQLLSDIRNPELTWGDWWDEDNTSHDPDPDIYSE